MISLKDNHLLIVIYDLHLFDYRQKLVLLPVFSNPDTGSKHANSKPFHFLISQSRPPFTVTELSQESLTQTPLRLSNTLHCTFSDLDSSVTMSHAHLDTAVFTRPVSGSIFC